MFVNLVFGWNRHGSGPNAKLWFPAPALPSPAPGASLDGRPPGWRERPDSRPTLAVGQADTCSQPLRRVQGMSRKNPAAKRLPCASWQDPLPKSADAAKP